MATLNGPAGADRLLSWGTYRAGYCLEAVSKALGAYNIASDRPGYYTYALRAWETTPESQRRYDRTPPKGAVVYLSAGGNGYGHICLSLGGGRVVSTDVPSNGKIGVTTIGDLERAWGRRFLGWAAYVMGHTITVDGSAGGGGGGGGAVAGYSQTVANEQAWLNVARNANLKVDGLKGDATRAAYRKYQTFLRAFGYEGAIDGDWGSGTQAAHARYYDAWQAAPAFPLPDGHYFGPEGGPATSVSGWHGHADDLRRWQEQMRARGWSINPDGLYGPRGAKTPQGETASVAAAFQREKGFNVDSLIGLTTWKGAWAEPVT